MKLSKVTFSLVLFLAISISSLAQQAARTRADKQFDKAVQLYNHHEFSNALRLIDDLLAYEPTYAKAWLLKADMYNDLQQYNAAVSSYSKAVEIDSSIFPPAY
jgi:Tfp pilus assembly protein PilF